MKRDWKGARTYRLRQTTIKNIETHAERLECWQSDLVDLILERGLEEIAMGRWAFNQMPVKFELGWSDSESASS